MLEPGYPIPRESELANSEMFHYQSSWTLKVMIPACLSAEPYKAGHIYMGFAAFLDPVKGSTNFIYRFFFSCGAMTLYGGFITGHIDLNTDSTGHYEYENCLGLVDFFCVWVFYLGCGLVSWTYAQVTVVAESYLLWLGHLRCCVLNSLALSHVVAPSCSRDSKKTSRT